jgi:hypothetical protein
MTSAKTLALTMQHVTYPVHWKGDNMPSLNLPMPKFQAELSLRTMKLRISFANKVAKRLAVTCKRRMDMGFNRADVLNPVTLRDMARLHQVQHELWDHVVKQVRELA